MMVTMLSLRLPGRIFSAVIGLSVVLSLCSTPGFSRSIPEIAILVSGDGAYYQQAVDGFRRVFPSQVLVKEYHLKGSLAKGRQIGETVRAGQPDLVLAVGLKAAQAAHLDIPDIPVIFCLVLNPALHGLPAPNMTGILMQPSNAKNFETMQAVLPKVRHIGLLYHQDQERSADFVTQARLDAQRLGLTLVASAVREQVDVPEALRALLPQIDLLWVTQDSAVLTLASIDFLLTTALDAKVPIFTFTSTLVQRGALAGLTLNPFDIGQQAGVLAQKILRGEALSHSRLLPPARTLLALNLHSAEYFGVHPSPEVMRMAGVLYGPGAVAQSDPRLTPVP
jgi:putative ABC transport system substrate-binding protein